MSEDVQETLGLPFEVFKDVNEKNSDLRIENLRLKAKVLRYDTMTIWGFIKDWLERWLESDA